jgi:hypothetical protein
MTGGINFNSDEFIEAPALDATRHPPLRGVTESKGSGVEGFNQATKGLGFLGGRDLIYRQNVGVYGESSQQGVFGHSTDAGTGVYGDSTGNGFGVRGDTVNGIAVQGQSFGSGNGVVGITKTATAVKGTCEISSNIDSQIESSEFQSIGVEGIGPVGVRGRGNTGIVGVGNPIGVYAFGDPGVFIKSKGSRGNLIIGQSPRRLPDGVGQDPAPYDTVFRVDTTGKGFFNGGTQSGGADVAEFISSSDSLMPCDVVEIDPDNPGLFRITSVPNSTSVAGVISTNPGVTLGARDASNFVLDARPQLALGGRVPVKVSLENGLIRPGDLLVTSSTPGHAMRAPANPLPGTVLGKSLGILNSKIGIIEMLIMLR